MPIPAPLGGGGSWRCLPGQAIVKVNQGLGAAVVSEMAAFLVLYIKLPDTPLRASVQDQRQARRLHESGVPLHLVESALLLASLLRPVRPAEVPPLTPIRSLAYFQPVIDELLAHPMPDNYLEYLRLKLRRMAGEKIAPADVQKDAFSDAR